MKGFTVGSGESMSENAWDYVGMKIVIGRDGDQYTAFEEGRFVNIQESRIGFGHSVQEAVSEFLLEVWRNGRDPQQVE
jgi:hypothetical protein